METLQRIQELMDQVSTQISNEAANAPKVNKAAQARIRTGLGEIKKLVTAARAESLALCKK